MKLNLGLCAEKLQSNGPAFDTDSVYQLTVHHSPSESQSANLSHFVGVEDCCIETRPPLYRTRNKLNQTHTH